MKLSNFARLRGKFRDNKPLFNQLIGHENKFADKTWVMRVVFHPLSNVRRWRASLNHGNGKCPADLKRDAKAAWRRFVCCVKSLLPDQAAPLWQTVLAEAASEAHVLKKTICGVYCVVSH
jgi:hypothetical protein